MANIIDSYSETNYDSFYSIADGGVEKVGQSFTVSTSNKKIGSAKFYLRNVGTGTGNCYAKLYAHSGTYGTSSIPTGSPLATSDAIDVTSITYPIKLITFTFSGANQYQMTPGYYCIVFDQPSGNKFYYGTDNSSPSASGNNFYYSGSNWTVGTRDSIFYIYEPDASGPANLKTYKGLASASVKTCKGLAIASVKSKKGLA